MLSFLGINTKFILVAAVLIGGMFLLWQCERKKNEELTAAYAVAEQINADNSAAFQRLKAERNATQEALKEWDSVKNFFLDSRLEVRNQIQIATQNGTAQEWADMPVPQSIMGVLNGNF